LETRAGRRELAQFVDGQLRSAIASRRNLKERWDANERMYRNQPGSSGFEIIEGIPVCPVPLMQPRGKRLISSTVGQLLAPNPWVQILPDGLDQKKADALEGGLQVMADRAEWAEAFALASEVAFCTGKAFIRVQLTPEGFDFRTIHPNDFVAGPAHAASLDECHLQGHRFYLTRQEIDDLVRRGIYTCDREASGGDSPDSEESGFDLSHAQTSDSVDDSPGYWKVEVWELFVRVVMNGELGWVQAHYSPTDQILFLCQEWEPSYVEVQFHQEINRFWPSTSKANELQGLQHQYTMLNALMYQGSLLDAMPPVVGPPGFARQFKKTRPGDILECPGGAPAVAVINGRFNPTAIPGMIELTERQADAIAGISQLGIGQQLTPGTTATEVTQLVESQKQNENTYARFAAGCFEKAWALMHRQCARHPQVVASLTSLPDAFYSSLGLRCRYRCTGRSVDATPAVQMAKLNDTYALSQDPDARMDRHELIKSAVRQIGPGIDMDALFPESVNSNGKVGPAPVGTGSVPVVAPVQPPA
jgi:hypothetical protein